MLNKKEGWEGKTQGLVQVLWERGLIDHNNLQKYSLNGKDNTLGITERTKSLCEIIGVCSDFINEEK